MRYKTFAMMLAAALLAGTMNFARGEDSPYPQDDPEIIEDIALDDMDDLDDADVDAPFAFRRDRRPGRGDWRGERNFGRQHCPAFGRGPGGPGNMPPAPMRNRGMRSGMMGGMGMGMGFGGRAWAEMELTDVQKKQLVDLLTNNFRARLETRMDMMDAAAKLRELRKNDDASGDDIIAANTAMGAARGKMAVQTRQFRQDLQRLLTPEQWKKIEDFRSGPGRRGEDNRRFEGRRPDGPRGDRERGPGPRGPGGPGPRGPGGPGGRK